MIKEIINISQKVKIVKLQCDKSGILFERQLDTTEDIDNKLGNVQAALCDAEIEKLKQFMGEKLKTDCWCKYLSKFIKYKDAS